MTESQESQNEIFDSLPYYDDDLQKFPILQQKVEQELARQAKPPSTLHPRVPPPFEPFSVREHVSTCMVIGS
jgi:pre-mRNA-splicing factor SPF27